MREGAPPAFVVLVCLSIVSELSCLLILWLESASRFDDTGLVNRWKSERRAALYDAPEHRAEHAAKATRLAQIILALALFGWAGSWIVLSVAWLLGKSRVPALLDDALVQPVKRRRSRQAVISAAAAAPEAGALSNPTDAEHSSNTKQA